MARGFRSTDDALLGAALLSGRGKLTAWDDIVVRANRLGNEIGIREFTIDELIKQEDPTIRAMAHRIITRSEDIKAAERLRANAPEEDMLDRLEEFSRRHIFGVSVEEGEHPGSSLTMRMLNPIAQVGVLGGLVANMHDNHWQLAGLAALMVPAKEMRDEIKSYQEDIERAEIKRDQLIRELRAEWIRQDADADFLRSEVDQNVIRGLIYDLQHHDFAPHLSVRNYLRLKMARAFGGRSDREGFRNMLLAKRVAELRTMHTGQEDKLPAVRTTLFKRLMRLEKIAEQENLSPQLTQTVRLRLLSLPYTKTQGRDLVLQEIARATA